MAWLAPNANTCRMPNTVNTGKATLKQACARSTWRFFSRYHALTLSIRLAPTIHEATQTCMSRGMKDGVKTTSLKLVMTAMSPPAVCMSW